MFKFHSGYALLTVILFVTEVCIALFLHDNLIRPFGGDFLVVMLLYCFVRSFIKVSPGTAAIAVLLFSYIIETLQYFQMVKMLGLQGSKLARVVLGTSFAWEDILAYTLG